MSNPNFMSIGLVQELLRNYECKHVCCDCGTTKDALAWVLDQPQKDWPELLKLGAEKLYGLKRESEKR
jgi:hypothetical protein